jgi:hypothetical protein
MMSWSCFDFGVTGESVRHRRPRARRWVIALGLAGAWWLAAPPAPAQHGSMGQMPTPSPLDTAAGAKHLADFRASRLAGDFCIRFQLVHLPRRGEETRYEGRAWGTWNEQGPRTRFELWPATASADGAAAPAGAWTWLVQNGPNPQVWVVAPGAATARAVPPAEWSKPLFPGLVYAPFDLLMPFIYWPDDEYDGPARVAGRAADLYLMRPPAAAGPVASPVRIALDREFSALLRAEQLDAAGQPARRFEVLSLQKFQGQWMVKTLDLLDWARHDTDRFTIAAAALRLQLDPEVFDSARLAAPAPLPAAAAWGAP